MFRGPLVAFLLVAALGCSQGHSRHLHCDRQPSQRRQQICLAIEERLELSVGGPHVLFSAGYKTREGALREIYCVLRLQPSDVPELQAISREQGDSRLWVNADELLWLLEPASAPAGSVYDPQSRAYVLREGCPAERGDGH